MHIAFASLNNSDGDLAAHEREMLRSINQFLDLYHAFFLLLIELQAYAQERIEIGRNKKLATPQDLNPNTRFADNRVIDDLRGVMSNTAYNNVVDWHEMSGTLVRDLYNKMAATDVYRAYMDAPADSYSNDKQIAYYVFEQLLPDSEELFAALEERSIYWNDDIELVLTMNIRTVQRMKETRGSANRLLPLFKDDDDLDFVKRLLRKTLLRREQSHQLIAELSQKWELDRIALIDKTIIEMAIAEMIEFPLIPVAITINEYLDIARFYCGEKSPVFINGILERAVERLEAEGRVRKVGTGVARPKEGDTRRGAAEA